MSLWDRWYRSSGPVEHATLYIGLVATALLAGVQAGGWA